MDHGCAAARKLGGGGAILHGHIGVLRGKPLRHHLIGAGPVIEEIADALLVGAQERVDLFDAVDVQAGGPTRAREARHRQFCRDPSAE